MRVFSSARTVVDESPLNESPSIPLFQRGRCYLFQAEFFDAVAQRPEGDAKFFGCGCFVLQVVLWMVIFSDFAPALKAVRCC